MATRRHRAALALLLVASATACSGGSRSDGRAWREIGEIDYLLPGTLPDGWVVRRAIERTGRPQSEWLYRADVYRHEDREEYLVVGGELSAWGDQPGLRDLGEHEPGAVSDADADELFYLFVYLGISAPYEEDLWSAREVSWGSGTLSRRVLLVGPGDHDDAVVERVAAQLVDARDLDFERPSAAEDAGFELVGSMTELEDVPDYSITWSAPKDAGRNLDEARDADARGPSLSINVYPRLLTQTGAIPGVDEPGTTLPTDPDDAEIERDDEGDVDLRFVRDGIGVLVSGHDVEPEAVRALARSLRTVSHDRWVDDLGDRLVVDEPDERER